jgi:hypothetical protein
LVVTVALAAPLNVTAAPLAPLIKPEIECVTTVKSTPVAAPPLIATFRLDGVKLNPVWLGVTV